MRINYSGELGFGVTPKDLILGTIGQMGTDGAAGHVVEYAGPVIEGLSMEGRMTICNMTIEGGGRAGMVAPDDTTFEWVDGRAAAPGPRLDRRLARAAHRRGRDASTRRSTSTRARCRRSSPGARTPGWSCRSPRRCPSRRATATSAR